MLRCPRCTRAGDSTADIRSTCGDATAGIIPCPEPVEVIPGRDLVLTCRKDDCGKTFAFPAERVIRHQIPPDVSCTFTACEIVATQPLAQAAQPKGFVEQAKDMVRGKPSKKD